MRALTDTVTLPRGRTASYEVVGTGEPVLYFQGGPGFSASLLREEAELLADRYAVYQAPEAFREAIFDFVG